MNIIVTLEILFIIFFGEIIADFLTGVLANAKEGKLKSRTCSNGMFRSIGEVIVLGIFIVTGKLVPGLESILSIFIIGFIFKELLSIIENLIKLDVWVPESIKKTLQVGIDKIENLELNNKK